MARISKLQDGDPLTLEWLNSLVEAINGLDVEFEQIGQAYKTIPGFISGMNNESINLAAASDSLVVECGTDIVTIEKDIQSGQPIVDSRKIFFNYSFKDTPTVIITPFSYGGGVSSQVRECTNSYFTYRAMTNGQYPWLIDANNSQFKINYIAIGR